MKKNTISKIMHYAAYTIFIIYIVLIMISDTSKYAYLKVYARPLAIACCMFLLAALVLRYINKTKKR
jgi:predicted Co/Zn/Cd cation transporter (cation efflux family)